MTKKIVLSAIAASVMASSVMATNGDNLIATGAKARGMGGTQIAASHGAESGMYNPAMIGDVKESLSASVTYFDPSVDTFQNSGISTATTYESSATSASIIPNVVYVKPINKELTVGLAVYGSAGMGTDFSTATASSLYQMRTALALLKVAVPVAYKVNDALTVGLAPVLMNGELDINYYASATVNQDNARSSDNGFGFELGANYKVNKDLNVAALYKSEIAMEYTNQIGTASANFGVNSGAGVASGDELNQPAEIGIGVSYKLGKGTINADFKQVNWGDASGYKEFNWENQNVIALGYAHELSKELTVRVGYNKADNPIVELDGTGTSGSNYDNAVINFFNMAGFPGVVEEHMTLGATYEVKKGLSIDAAVVIASEVTNSVDTGDLSFAFSTGNVTTGTVDNTHSQMSYTIGVNYLF